MHIAASHETRCFFALFCVSSQRVPCWPDARGVLLRVPEANARIARWLPATSSASARSEYNWHQKRTRVFYALESRHLYNIKQLAAGCEHRCVPRRGRGGVSPRGPSDRRPARQTVNVWVALIGAASPSGQRCALGEGERVLHKPRAGRDALGPRVGNQRLSAESRRIGDFGRAATQPPTGP